MAIQPGGVISFQIHGDSFMLWALVTPDRRIVQMCDSEETADWFLGHVAKNGGRLSKRAVGVWTSENLDRLEGFWIDGKRYEVK